MRRLRWVLLLGLCSCPSTLDGLGQAPAGGGPAAHGGEAGTAAGSSGAGSSGAGSGASSSSGSGGQVCSSGQCDATGRSLEAYCNLEHARCPVDMAHARADACANSFAIARQSYSNACGGESIRIRYTFGSVEFYFDASGKIAAVTTLTNSKAGPCDASFYRYGDQRCAPAGKDTDIPCE